MSSILAYFDPGPGSLLVQALMGGAAGLLVFGKYLWNSALDSRLSHTPNTRGSNEAAISSDSSGEIRQDALK